MPRYLFHFSENASIACFEPRPVRVPSLRPPGLEYLNGPLVWAIDDAHSFMYLFPRACPRILIWATSETNASDRTRWFSQGSCRAIAYVEVGWLPGIRASTLFRYTMSAVGFQNLNDAGMWVSRHAVTPADCAAVQDLERELGARGVELRAVEALSAVADVWPAVFTSARSGCAMPDGGRDLITNRY